MSDKNLPEWGEVKHLAEVSQFTNGDWVGSYGPLEICIVGETEDAVWHWLENAYNTHKK